MPFEHGTFSFTIFKLPKNIPDNYIELLNNKRAGSLENLKDEIQVGWTGYNHLLENILEIDNTQLGGFIFFQMRIAKKKISPSQLKAAIKLEEMAHIRANNNIELTKKIKRKIKEEVTERLRKEAIADFSGTEIVIDQNENTLYLGSCSIGIIDTFIQLFVETFDFAPIQIVPEELINNNQYYARQYNPIKLPKTHDNEYTPGRDFLTWLWYYSEEKSGIFELSDYGELSIMIDGPLTFLANAEGATETIIKKGNTINSAEAKTALMSGKKLAKAKIILARDKSEFFCSFDADNFAFSGMKLPEGEEMDRSGKFSERINNLYIFKKSMLHLFNKLLKDTENIELLNNNIEKWIKSRAAL